MFFLRHLQRGKKLVSDQKSFVKLTADVCFKTFFSLLLTVWQNKLESVTKKKDLQCC
jgi:hypothetical protein